MNHLIQRAFSAGLLLAAVSMAATPIKPAGKDGKPLNLDFETGTLKDWTATGDAFDGQPIQGDAVAARRNDMHSQHQGRFWIGGFEIKGDDATGTLTSVPFPVTHRWASFLVAGGAWPETRVELVRADDQKVFFKSSGTENEGLRPVVVDLKELAGKDIFIRLVDERKGPWGHVNFDDFEFYDERPKFDNKLDPAHAAAEAPPQPDVVLHAGVKPEDGPKIMTLPEGFHATLFAGEPDIVQPIAFTIDQRGRLWVVEGMTYPRRAPEGQGKDRILIFEDEKGEGHFTKRTVFAEGLNLVSGIEVGFGGVFVGAAPNLLFIPVTDWDNPKPAGEPKVLLDGFGYDDTHETLNTFTWGPDGWLYGCHGVFVQSFVGAPGTPREQRVHINAGIWRYQPTRKIFERFAEGTSNPWGMDFDAHGQMIIEACVIPHLWHIIQGGHYQRQAGQHDNPYVFDDIKTIADHLHWGQAANPWAANGRAAAFGGGHAHAGLLVYQGGQWPDEYAGRYFMNNIHGSRINMDVPEPRGSGFVGHHGKDLVVFNDTWSRVVNLRTGPDGSVFMIDWYDATHCHTTDPKQVDRGNGRIYKLTYGSPKSTVVNLDGASDLDLAKLQLATNDWHARTARRLLQEHFEAGKLDPSARAYLADLAKADSNEVHVLRALWALHVTGGIPEELAVEELDRDDTAKPYLAAWTIQLACERSPSPRVVDAITKLAWKTPSPIVRLYVASAAQRLSPDQTWGMVGALLTPAGAAREDATDHNLPLMDWYALEPLAGKDPGRALKLAVGTKIPNVLTFTVRRIAAGGDDKSLAALVDALGHEQAGADAPAWKLQILSGIVEALHGRRTVPMPPGWSAVEAGLLSSGNTDLAEKAAALGVTFGSDKAIELERHTLSDASADAGRRMSALSALLSVKDSTLPETLRKLLADEHVRIAALRGLAQYDDAQTPPAVLAAYPSFDPSARKEAITALSSRPDFARALLAAVASEKVPARDISADVVRQLRNLHDEQIDQQVTKVWGVVRDSPQDKLNRIAQLRQIIERPGPAPDPGRGRALFNKTCSQCHTLFDSGGHVGPEITGSNRADLSYLLQRVVDPNFAVPNEYRPTIVRTTDDRTLIGIVKKEDPQSLTLQTATELLTIPTKEVSARKLSPLGMMPEGLLDNFPDNDVRDLVAYLRSPAQVPVKN